MVSEDTGGLFYWSFPSQWHRQREQEERQLPLSNMQPMDPTGSNAQPIEAEQRSLNCMSQSCSGETAWMCVWCRQRGYSHGLWKYILCIYYTSLYLYCGAAHNYGAIRSNANPRDSMVGEGIGENVWQMQCQCPHRRCRQTFPVVAAPPLFPMNWFHISS